MKLPQRSVYFIFFLSGVAGLMYEIVWGRLFVLIFGATTNSIVAVVSAFLGGLSLGSLLAGRAADKMSPKALLKTYSILEVGIGLLSLLTLLLIPAIREIYGNFTDGSSVTTSLIVTKFALSSLVILLPTTLMGATLPILVKYLTLSKNAPEKIVSLLYALNTFGGVIGVILAAFFLIELVGIQLTVVAGVAINLLIAILIRLIKLPQVTQSHISKVQVKEVPFRFTPLVSLVIISFFASGLISIAYQILWTRVLTPSLGTVIYAFASILVIYLLGIAFGSLVYGKLLKFIPSKLLFFALCEAGIGIFALMSVLILHKFQISGVWELIIRVLPATILMGLTFPAVVALLKEQKSISRVIGVSYFSNTVGTIVGGFLASFILIPLVGTSQSIALLAVFNIAIAVIFIYLAHKTKLLILFSLILLVSSYIGFFKGDRLFSKQQDFLISDARLRGEQYGFAEDEVASVFAIKDNQNKELHLIIDGVETTHKTIEVRLMAHIPANLHPNPKRVLVIAFGMGTTYRSALMRGLEVDAVELVPSVPKFMPLFHSDADSFLTNPKGKVIINDGRNYAFLTDKRYDIVIIDPPPPFNTAGSTVLHSKEFYQDLSKKLNEGGIVSQWIYYDRSREDEISMAIKSFVDVFPYVLGVQYSFNNGGIYLEGSHSLIDGDRLANIYKDEVAIKDLQDIAGTKDPLTQSVPVEIIADRDSLLNVVKNYPPITDNNPRSEYYLLRHFFTNSPVLVNEEARKFIERLRAH